MSNQDETKDRTRSDAPSHMKAGMRPGDSMRELRHAGQNNGITEEEETRRQGHVDAAAAEADRLRDEPGHTGRDHL